MSAPEIFGLVLRVCGLVLLYKGAMALAAPVVIAFGMGNFSNGFAQSIVPVISIVVSLYLLRGAPAFMRFCYGRA